MITCIGHRGCPDGFGALYSMWRKFGLTAEYKTMLYGERVPTLYPGPHDSVYFGDFCPDWDSLLDLSVCKSVTILDHHISQEPVMTRAREELGYNIVFDNEHSGAVITWKYLHPNKEVPQLLLHVEDRDLWKFELPNTHEIMEAVWSYPREFELWDKFDIPTLVSEGRVLLRAKDQAIKSIINNVRIIEIDNTKVPAINTSLHFSDALHHVLHLEKYLQYPFGA